MNRRVVKNHMRVWEVPVSHLLNYEVLGAEVDCETPWPRQAPAHSSYALEYSARGTCSVQAARPGVSQGTSRLPPLVPAFRKGGKGALALYSMYTPTPPVGSKTADRGCQDGGHWRLDYLDYFFDAGLHSAEPKRTSFNFHLVTHDHPRA
jgi:hypothetical protein